MSGSGGTVSYLNKLLTVREIALKPFQFKALDTYFFEFFLKNLMVTGVKGLLQITKNSNGIFFFIEGSRDFVQKVDHWV